VEGSICLPRNIALASHGCKPCEQVRLLWGELKGGEDLVKC